MLMYSQRLRPRLFVLPNCPSPETDHVTVALQHAYLVYDMRKGQQRARSRERRHGK